MGKETEFNIRPNGGLNTLLPEQHIEDNQTPSCNNVNFDRGRLEKRPGYMRLINSAYTEPALKFNSSHGSVRIPAHTDFVYGTVWEIVIKFRITQDVTVENNRETLYCHGYAGGTTVSSVLFRAIWIFFEGVDDSGIKSRLRLVTRDQVGNIQKIDHASNLDEGTNYAAHVRRTAASGNLEIEIWDLDAGAEKGSTVSTATTAANATYDASALPINIGCAPVLDTAPLSSISSTSIGVDPTGGKRYASFGSSERGAVQENFNGVIGEAQIWIDQDGGSRTVSAVDNERLDTLDTDVAAGSRLLAYYLFNEGQGTTVACNTNYSINDASSKDATILGFRPQFVTGLVGDGKTRHALQFDGYDQHLHVIDRPYSADTVGSATRIFPGLLEFIFLNNNDEGLARSGNPWTFEYRFEFHKNSDEYNTNRKQCLCSLWYKYAGTSGPTDQYLPYMVVYIDESEVLKVDIASAVATDGTLTYATLTADTEGTLTKDTTYHFALMKYGDATNGFRYLQLYVDGVRQASGSADLGAGGQLPDFDGNTQVHSDGNTQVHLFFGMNGAGAGSLATAQSGIEWDASSTGYRDSCTMPSNCTIDEVRLWGMEDSSGNPVGARDTNSGGTAVPSAENPPTENLILKYHDKEIADAEITDKEGLWLYYPFYEDWIDYESLSNTHQWVEDKSRYRYLPGLMVPASMPPRWTQGIITKTTVDTDYANNSLVHNQTGPIEYIRNYVQEDGTQELLHVQASVLRSFTTGNSYTDQDEHFQLGNLTSDAPGKNSLFMVHGPIRPVKWDGSNLRIMGIPPPTAQIHSGYTSSQMRAAPEGNLLASNYYTYRYTWYNKTANIESDPSPESPALFTFPATLGSAATEILLSVPRITDPQVTHIRIYRSPGMLQNTGDITGHSSKTASANSFRFVAEIPNVVDLPNIGEVGAPSAETWWEGVGTGLGPTLSFRNATPPKDPQFIVYWRDRTFCARTSEYPSRVFFSESGFPESYHPDNYLSFDEGDGQAITAMVPIFNYLMVFKANSIYVISEEGGSVSSLISFPFSKFKHHTNVGAASHFACQKLDENQVLFLSQKGVYLTDGVRIQYLSRAVENIFRDEISRATLAAAYGAVYKKRNQYILALSTDGVSNDVALVYDYVTQTWTRWDFPMRTIVQTEDSTGIERIFHGGVIGRGYLNRFDSSDTDGAELIRPATPTEPANGTLTGTVVLADAGTTTTLIDADADWDTVTGDMMRGMEIKITKSGASTSTTHVAVFTDSTGGKARITFQPPLSAATTTGDTWIIAGIDGRWDSKQFNFGRIRDIIQLQDMDIFQAVQSHAGVLTGAVKVDKGSFQVNTNTLVMTSYAGKIPFKGTGWVSGGGTARGRLLQVQIRNRNPNEDFDIHDIVLTVSPFEAER